MGRVTNRVGVEALRGLLEGVRSGALAYVNTAGAVQGRPVACRWRDGRFRVGLAGEALPAGSRVALAVDDGAFWWELRAVLVRGVLVSSEPPNEPGDPGLTWFDLVADRTTGWDYGKLHEES